MASPYQRCGRGRAGWEPNTSLLHTYMFMRMMRMHVQVDGRTIGDTTDRKRGPVTTRLQQLYMQLMEEYAALGRDGHGI